MGDYFVNPHVDPPGVCVCVCIEVMAGVRGVSRVGMRTQTHWARRG